MNAKQRGVMGEELAAASYQNEGYRVLAANYRTRMGEVDVVAQKDNVLVFVEVKTRGVGAIAQPREWVDIRKQRRIISAAENFIAENQLDCIMRFDVVEVWFENPAAPKIQRIENAFTL